MKRCLLFAFLIMLGCNELPVGGGELHSRGDFEAEEIQLLLDNTFTETDVYPFLGNSLNLALGKERGYESRVLVRFNFPDTSYEGLDEIRFVLTRNDVFDKDTIQFSLHLLLGEFQETKANWQQRTDVDFWMNEGADYEADPIYTGVIDEDSLVVLFNYFDLQAIIASQGMILIPEDSGFVYFYSREGGPAPQFVLKKNDDVTPVAIEADCHIVTGPDPFFIDPWIGSGLLYRNYVRFFFDSLLIDQLVIFADLTFTVEDHFAKRDSVAIGVRELLEPISDFDTPVGPLIAFEKVAADDSIISIDIVRHIQRITEHPDSNFGFFVLFSPETYDIANMKVIRGSHEITVGYVQPAEERY
ncbi:hypothetical protein AMJ87_13780 [candidate division WOR_3 bacterium SM23_60]|uniref:DNRLRE domain-containing protein n=1 Tax=candidate division WOR_3 bacterium SM23_60 TaxID=1703780 RepID=A0A0S8G2B5_UNCW3|nr:MAG: hypothetical protein AMJ87_13780 [candidate division WOR_3 bacterium SM23_60]